MIILELGSIISQFHKDLKQGFLELLQKEKDEKEEQKYLRFLFIILNLVSLRKLFSPKFI